MNAIEQLREEHAYVLRMLDVIDRVADRLSDGRPVVAMDFARILEFVSGFVQKCHHAKEQDLLFPLLAETDAGLVYGVIGRLVVEHGQNHMAADNLFNSAMHLNGHDRQGSGQLAASMRDYSAAMRQHIALEESEAFDIAEDELSFEAQKFLVDSFEALERERFGAEGHQHFVSLLEQLERSYGHEAAFVYSK